MSRATMALFLLAAAACACAPSSRVAPAPVAPASAKPAAVPDVATINEPGQPVEIAAHLVPGQFTIIDVYSPYCGPCMRAAPKLERFAVENPRIVLRKVDINRPGVRGIDWRSPVVQQLGIRSVPHIVVYGPAGDVVAEGNAVWNVLAHVPAG